MSLTFRALFDKKAAMNARLITPVAALLSVLSIAAQPGQVVRNIQVSDGPTPFIRFVHTSVSDVARFEFAQFLILPKTGSATRPIRVRYARSYLEARGYFDPQTGKVTVPVFGLYAGRLNRVVINLGFSGRVHRTQDFLSASRRLPMTEARTPIQPSFSHGYQAPL
jgi:hypothetical protein